MDAHGKFFWEEFLILYKNLPCLWNSKLKTYSTKEARTAALDILVNKCKEINPNANKDYVTKKIHNFRCGFRRELKKVKEAKKSEQIYVPTLWYYETLGFLIDNTRQSVEPVEEDDEEQEIDLSKDIKLEEDEDSNIDIIHNNFEMTPNSDNSRLSPTYLGDDSNNKNNSKLIKKRKKFQQKSEDENIGNFNNKFIYAAPISKQYDEDIFDYVGKKLAWDLKEINGNNPKQRIIAEKLINDVIFYAQMGALSEFSSILINPQTQSNYMTANQICQSSYGNEERKQHGLNCGNQNELPGTSQNTRWDCKN